MTCPICSEDTDQKYRPFCSKKCADIDLGRWFNGTYTAPADDADELGDAKSELEKPKSLPH